MKSLILLIKKGVLLIWIFSFYQCWMKQEELQTSPLKLTQDIEQRLITKPYIKDLEKKLYVHPTLLEKQQTSLLALQEKDIKSYPLCKKPALQDLELVIPFFTWTMMKQNQAMSFGHTNTSGNTLNYVKKEIQ